MEVWDETFDFDGTDRVVVLQVQSEGSVVDGWGEGHPEAPRRALLAVPRRGRVPAKLPLTVPEEVPVLTRPLVEDD